MANKNIKIFLKGKHEKRFIENWRENHGTFFRETKIQVIHMNQIDAHCDSNVEAADKIIVVADNDNCK